MKRIFKIILIVLFVIVTICYFFATYDAIIVMFKKYDLYLGFFIGLGIFIVLVRLKSLTLQNNIQFLSTFSHELTHTIFNFVFFNKVSNFNATAISGGMVSYYGKSNFIISLTPYCFPIFTFPILLINSFLEKQYWFAADIFVGLTYAFHACTFLKQTSGRQPDLQKHGVIFSYIFLIMMNIIFFGLILSNMRHGGIKAFDMYFSSGFDYFKLLFAKLT